MVIVLIVAMPKSASTALLETLGELYDLESFQPFDFGGDLPPGYEVLPSYHSGLRDLPSDDLGREWARADAFVKEHLPPTETNREALADERLVVLVREPEAVVGAYCRAEQKGIHEPRKEFEGCSTEEEWLKRAEENGLLADLAAWREGWLDHRGDTLVVEFDDLVADPTKAIQAIARYWSLEVPEGPIELKRARYSRESVLRKRVREFARRIYDRIQALRG